MQNDSPLNNIIRFEHVGKIYTPENVVALRDVSFDVQRGEFICLIGPSGEGKTTILKLIAGIEEKYSGTIVKPEEVAMAFQTVALFPWLSVYDNIALGLRVLGKSDHYIKATVRKYIELMRLEPYVSHRPVELSGGQKQRVGIARALAVEPHVLLLDEPFSALDPRTTAELHDDLITIWKETGNTIIMVSHLIEEAVSLATRVFLIKNGSLEHIFPITLSYPRREQEIHFIHEVSKVRKEFFKNAEERK